MVFDDLLVALVVGFILIDEQKSLRVLGGSQIDYLGVGSERVPKQHRRGDLHIVHPKISVNFVAVLSEQLGDGVRMVDQTVGHGENEGSGQRALLEPSSLGVFGITVNRHVEPGELMQDGEVPDIERPTYPARNFSARDNFIHKLLIPFLKLT
ncbi:MAG: hypothetical protein IPM75_16910 [Candidatus Competibacteraceae bacterium]|nr:hypothetical protein [Candidatus Competibacteraceae bacterium]